MKNFKVDDSNGIPVWIQVRKRLVYCIVSGQYEQGEQLPTVRELAVDLDINYNTVNKVYQDLEREGLIVTKRGKGTFVAEFDKGRLLPLDNKVDMLADEFVRSGFEFGMTGQEIIALVSKKIDHVEKHEPGWSSSSKPATKIKESMNAG